MRIIILTILFFSIFLSLDAQNSSSNSGEKLGVSITPSALFNTYSMLQIGASGVFNKKELYIDYGFTFGLTTGHNTVNQSGKRFKLGVKFFKNKALEESSPYYEIFLLSRNTLTDEGDISFERKLKGIAAGYGFSRPIGHGFLLQIGGGLGIGTMKVKTKGDPNILELLLLSAYSAASYRIDGNYSFPIAYMNIRIVKVF